MVVAFALIERRQLPRAEPPEFLAGLSFCQSVNARYMGDSNEQLAQWLARDLLRVDTWQLQDGLLVAV